MLTTAVLFIDFPNGSEWNSVNKVNMLWYFVGSHRITAKR
jgi:hypothetical protein